MKFYLSSYEIGNYGEKFSQMLEGTNKKVGYISNALDYTNPDTRRLEKRRKNDMKNLENLGAIVELLDLKNFFDKHEALEEKLSGLAGVFVSGGNTFILRQAFFLSGFDTWLQKNISSEFIYGGYSAGCCVLQKSLKGLQIVDNPADNPYLEMQETLWDGLGILDYNFLPHYNSDHPESADIDKEIIYAIENKIPFKAFRDGEVEIFEMNKL
jgi:dipeptidase E